MGKAEGSRHPEKGKPTLTLARSEEHTSELQSRSDLVCRLLLEKKKKKRTHDLVLKLDNHRNRSIAQSGASSLERSATASAGDGDSSKHLYNTLLVQEVLVRRCA